MESIICNLMCLECNLSSEHDGDELFIKHNGKKIWPLESKYVKWKTDSRAPLNVMLHDIRPGEQVVLQLWDYNFLAQNRLLGEFSLAAEKTSGYCQSDLRRLRKYEIARYTLEFEMLPGKKKTSDVNNKLSASMAVSREKIL